jgi:hypothetical protein
MFFFPAFGKQGLEHPKLKVSLLYISSCISPVSLFQHLSKFIDAGFHVAVFIGWHQNKKHKDSSREKM